MKSRVKIQVQSKEIVKEQTVRAGIAGEVQVPAINTPAIDVEIEVEYTPSEVAEDWETIKKVIKELPEVIKDLKEVADLCMSYSSEASANIATNIVKDALKNAIQSKESTKTDDMQ